MEYKVMNYEAAEKYATQHHDKSAVVVSIYSPIYKPANIYCSDKNNIKDILFLCFCDMDTDKYYQLENYDKGLITESQAIEIFDFCEKWYDKIDILIFHCEGGISRSAGCAAAIMRWYEGDDDPIFRMKKKYPNMYCYNKVLDACRGITKTKVSRVIPDNNC